MDDIIEFSSLELYPRVHMKLEGLVRFKMAAIFAVFAGCENVREAVDAENTSIGSNIVLVEGGILQRESEFVAMEIDTFQISRYPVDWSEWKIVRDWAALNGYDIGAAGDGCAADHPVHSVSWYDVLKWCNALSEIEGLTPVYTIEGSVYRSGEFGWASGAIDWDESANGYRLPSEMEWEFSARGGNDSQGYTYSGSDDLNEVGWYYGNSSGAACDLADGKGTWPVGRKVANELGLYDMSGNVWEWCWDASASYRRVRGGSWASYAGHCAVSYAEDISPSSWSASGGFRIARNLGQ